MMMDELQYDSTAQENQRKNMEQQIPGLVICYIAIEACHRNSGFTHLSMVDLSIVFC
jgi:hypothetical protein